MLMLFAKQFYVVGTHRLEVIWFNVWFRTTVQAELGLQVWQLPYLILGLLQGQRNSMRKVCICASNIWSTSKENQGFAHPLTKQKWPALLATLCYENPQCIGCMWSLVIYALSFCPDKTFVQEVLSKTKLKLSGTKILSKIKKTVFSYRKNFKMTFPRWIWVFKPRKVILNEKSFYWAEGRGKSLEIC